VGGEWAYAACVFSKAMLRSAQVRFDSHSLHAVGGTTRRLTLDDEDLAFAAAAVRRDEVAEHGDDSGAAKVMSQVGVTVVRRRHQLGRMLPMSPPA
jgi:pyruvate/2-oxoglutarate dehydrogenase complex dihydrolipoamide dehydrogenase (E3) component